MPPEEIDSLADDVKPLVLALLEQISGLTARIDELVAQNKALLVRIAELEAEHGKPPKTPDNSSLPPSRGQKGNVAEPTRVKKARKGHPGTARALAENPHEKCCQSLTRFSEMESEKACNYNDHYDYADDVENIHRSAPIGRDQLLEVFFGRRVGSRARSRSFPQAVG
jgi:hypothetical protein